MILGHHLTRRHGWLTTTASHSAGVPIKYQEYWEMASMLRGRWRKDRALSAALDLVALS